MFSDDKGASRGEIMMIWLHKGRCDNEINVRHGHLPWDYINIWGNLIKKTGFSTVSLCKLLGLEQSVPSIFTVFI